MFTPQEVSEKTFSKVSFGGYSMTGVDEFLDTLTEDYTALYKENATLKAKLKVLAEKVEEYRATEDAMRSTLLTAQRMAAQMVQDAQTEKDQVLAAARAEAAAEIARLDGERAAAEQKLAVAQTQLADFVRRSQELIAAQSAFLAQLPEMEVAAAPASPVTQDTIRIIGQDIVRGYAEESTEEAPVEEPAQEVTAEPDVEEVPISEAFRMDLDELKFGRNYSGE
ncbi:MAG: DivIVA domain-containing protein [Ruminococcaceae bacterium]|nr:DivIVA domain-containing protein [Oscillospiraceae bacterium]